MNRPNSHDERIARMTFASVYPHYLTKVEKKGRTKEELHRVISWLTGFSEETLQNHIEGEVTFVNDRRSGLLLQLIESMGFVPAEA